MPAPLLRVPPGGDGTDSHPAEIGAPSSLDGPRSRVLGPSFRHGEKRTRALEVSIWFLSGVATGLAIAILSSSEVTLWLEKLHCPFLVATGIPCPLCGLTRAGRALLRGDLVAAVRMNPAILGVVGWASLVWIAWGIRSISGKSALLGVAFRSAGALGALLTATWLLRFAFGTEIS